MKYKAIIFDLDGTAIPNALHALPTERLVAAIKQSNTSFKLCAATGRPLSNCKHLLSSLGLVKPCVISAGTEIIDPVSDKVLWEYDIEPADAQKVLEICRPYSYQLLVGNEDLGDGQKASVRTLPERVNVMYLMQCSLSDAVVIVDKLSQVAGITASEVPSWKSGCIDIHVTNKSATKEHAIAKLLEIIDVRKEEAVGVGDGNNDVHLFSAVGLKVAMGNGTELLKSKADIICDTAENDGLAKFIEEILSKEA